MTPHARSLDQHALECLDALLREKSVSRAAERIGLSQSAMSEMLARLRERLGDPLLVRGRGGMVPTPHAESLAPRLREVLDRLAALAEPAFEAASCRRRFRIATSDYTQFLLMPPLVAALAKEAPQAGVDVLPVHILAVEAALEAGDVDLAVAYFVDPPAALRRLPLFEEHYVWIARAGHPDAADGMTPAAWAALPHLTVAPSGLTYFSGVVDRALGELELARRAVVSSPHFLLAAHLVAQSDLVLALPSRAAARLAERLPLVVRPLPFATAPIQLSMYWHERTHASAAQQWFRVLVREALPRR